MSRKSPGADRLRAYAKQRKRTEHLGDIEAVTERMRELIEELGRTTDRTRVLAIGEQRKLLLGLLEVYALSDEIGVMDELAKQIDADRRERAEIETGVMRASRAVPLPAFPGFKETDDAR